jgi:hypothetical protein
MVFERITLIDIYDTLKVVETNEKRVSSILINRSSKYGTKTLPRFDNLAQLKKYIIDNYPYRKVDNPECECYTCNEGITLLLNFSVDDIEDRVFVNNLRIEFESAKAGVLNQTSVKAIQQLFSRWRLLQQLYSKFVCYGYVQPQPTYWNPCEYTQFITNQYYADLIDKYYKATRRADFPGERRMNC